MNNNSGHRAAITLPAAKQDAPPVNAGKNSEYANVYRQRLLKSIEERERQIGLQREQYKRMSEAGKMAHRMHESLLDLERERLADLPEETTNNQGGAI